MNINFKTMLIIFLVALLGAGVGTFGVLSFYESKTPQIETKENNEVIINEVKYNDIVRTDYTKAIDKVFNTVVEINCSISTSASQGFFFFYGESESTSSGSGVIFSEDGYIVTNHHVIENANEDSIKVKLYNGEVYDARIVGSDSRTDLAVLKIDARNLEYSSFADSSQLMLGQDVIAIGNPLGLGISCSNGIVSALEKEIYINNVYMTVIQTNAAVNAGNSGGGLFDINGYLVGIVNAKKSSTISSSVEGMGYAIPSNTAIRIIQDIMDNGYVKNRAALGIKVYTAGSYYNVDGVLISEVIEGGGASEAGLQKNDIITAVDGQKISSYADLSKILDAHAAGDIVTVTVTRGETTKDYKIKLQLTANN